MAGMATRRLWKAWTAAQSETVAVLGKARSKRSATLLTALAVEYDTFGGLGFAGLGAGPLGK